jgi:hypothetical protein
MENMMQEELELLHREQDIRRELITVFFKHDMPLSHATEILSALDTVVDDTTAQLEDEGSFTFAEVFENEEGMEAVLLAKLAEIAQQHIDELTGQLAAHELNELGL